MTIMKMEMVMATVKEQTVRKAQSQSLPLYPPAVVENLGGPLLTSIVAGAVTALGYLPAIQQLEGLDPSASGVDGGDDLMRKICAFGGTPGAGYLAIYLADKMVSKAKCANLIAGTKGAVGSRILDMMRCINRDWLEVYPTDEDGELKIDLSDDSLD
ncbi:unnamed protein product [Amoebophrya sp. A25]|nr:unnamed protein product [Amoebophrya sp. A25]|eukprot:GSA25T00021561001.1